MIKLEQKNKIAVIQLYRPPANAIDIELCSALEKAIKTEIESDSKAIVLTGQGSIFSAGVDLVQLLNGGTDYISPVFDKSGAVARNAVFLPQTCGISHQRSCNSGGLRYCMLR